MTPEKLERLKKAVDAVHAKHTAHPAILLVQPENRREIYVLMVGSPSREWICHVLDDVLMRLAGSVEESQILSMFNAAPKTKVHTDPRSGPRVPFPLKPPGRN